MPSKSRKSKANPTIVVALIGLAGTLITALFASPIIIELIKRSDVQETSTANTSTLSLPATLIFSQSFDDGNTSGLALRNGNWQVIRDESSRVLEFSAVGNDIPAGIMLFGPSTISDVIIEFRLKFKKLSGVYLNFHEQEKGKYVVSFDPNDSVVVWATYIYDGTNSGFSPLESQLFTFQQDKWYLVRVEARDNQVIVTIDDNRIVSGFDTLFSNGSLRFELQPEADILLDDINIWSFEK